MTSTISPALNAAEFATSVADDRTIRLPDDIAARLLTGQDVRILLTWSTPEVEYDYGTDEEWAQMGAYMMAKGYEDDEADEDRHDLPSG